MSPRAAISLELLLLPEVLAEMRTLVASLDDAPQSAHAREMLAMGLALRHLGAPRSEASRILTGVERNHQVSPASAVGDAIARAYRDRG